MNTQWTKGFALSVVGLLLVGSAALASSRVVIDELRKLRASLPANDPSRKELSLRLADRLSDEVLVNPEKNARVEPDRKEAISLYQEVLPGMNGGTKAKVQFQLARLYMEKANEASAQNFAKNLFEEVSKQSDLKDLKRESTLRLAEIAEANPKTANSASTYYTQVLGLCEGTDSCSYAHYRLAWIQRNQDHFVAAVDEMKLALYDAKGQVREEAIRDLIGFMGLSGNVSADMSYVDSLSIILTRPNLLQDLASAYFSNGNKNAGVTVLALTHSRKPTLESEVRLMEEYYGLRNWDQFRLILGQFQESVKETTTRANVQDAAEIEKICRRLATQLDGERTSDKSHFDDFKAFTLSYLELFPESSERAKIMEGYIAAEPATEVKLAQLKTWLANPKFKLPVTDQINFREMRASIAQKDLAKNESLSTVVTEEMTALLALEATQPKVKAKARDYHYARARANYAVKNFAASTPEFEALANVTDENPDSLTIQSQQLLLDTYNQQKNLGKIVSTVHLWTENAALKKNPKLASELQEMAKVGEEAQFQQAIAQGQTEASLDQFTKACGLGKFLPKSCDNAKILAVNLQNYPKLLEVMEIQQKQNTVKADELAAEYENGGYYSKAGELLQKLLGKTADFKEELKVALMYELGRNLPSRDAVLKQLSSQVLSGKVKLGEPEENAFFGTMRDANLLDAKFLKVASSPKTKISVAEAMEEVNHGTAETKALLLAQPGYQGIAWSKLVLAKTEQLANEVSKIKFYGRNGQATFQKRVNRLKEFNQFAEKYLSGGADLNTRVVLLTRLKQNYDEMNSEILASPMPPKLSEEQLAQVKTGLAEMAKPFAQKSAELQTLLSIEQAKVASGGPAPASASDLAVNNNAALFDTQGYEQAVGELHHNPKSQTALQHLKQIFASSGMTRLASYFDGRMQATAMVGGNHP